VQAFVGHLFGAVRHRIVHDVQQSFDIARSVRAVRLADAQAPGDGAAHCGQVQALAFDGRRRHGLLSNNESIWRCIRLIGGLDPFDFDFESIGGGIRLTGRCIQGRRSRAPPRLGAQLPPVAALQAC
jgi:hypothetical protein